MIILEVTLGPNKGLVLEEFSDANGKATFRYTSKVTGTDELVAQVPSWVESIDNALIASLPARVTWTGGPDLVIELFIPPVIKTEGGRPVSITEITGNHGNTTAGHSITRYYISTDPIIDPYDDRPIGERAIPSLEPWTSSIGSLKVLLPDDLPAGTYYVGACADADQAVIELDEQNNCVVNQLAIALEPVQNQPPDCTQARPSSDILWPPNHKLVSITILGVSDPDGDQIAITITKITQDEPVNGLGDGDTIPDGFVIGTSEAKVRAERSGIGNGRVYVISFIAEDSKGGTCTGKVQVGVPHDQGKSKIPIDDGQVYDSTLP
ncbi:MAG: CARDB domain-containing protein [Nitrospirota bacterium]|nr:CARDB domain-containing protein [Nitrospirota bacterium]